jgi:apolipoprotein D and lipocalin family protein
MMRPMKIALSAALLAAVLTPLSAQSLAPLELVPALDPARYAGRWFEVARYQHGFEKGLVGVTADYGIRPDGRIDVVNSGRRKSLDGNLSTVKALAWRPDPARPGALKVRFFGLFASDYLVFGLDEKDYRWAVVGENTRKYLWFLARDPAVDPEVLEKMKAIAEGQGYDLARLYLVPQS